MPFFGSNKKKDDKNEKSEKSGKGYPTAGPSYPTGSYPTAGQPAQSGYQQNPPPGAPPPYQQIAPPQQQFPQQQYQPQQYGQPPPPQGFQQQYRQPQTVVVNNGFDAGARFDGNTAPTIPPPPPGIMPNAGQIAAAQGNNVVLTQRPDNFFSGGSDGGYVIW